MTGERIATVQYWDENSKWYQLWLEHNNYHERIIGFLTTIVKPQWKILDIGGGSGVLSIPLITNNCEVVMVEPSTAMRKLLYGETNGKGMNHIYVDERRWEDISPSDFMDYDLILACNSLHLTRIGFKDALEKIFMAKPKHVCIVTEHAISGINTVQQFNGYSLLFSHTFETESSYVYHNMDEAYEHWAFKEGHALCPDEKTYISSKLIFKNRHFWLKDATQVFMYLWKGGENNE